MDVRGMMLSPATLLSQEQYETSRMQCAELSRNELDLVILGQITALLRNCLMTTAHRPSIPRHRSTMSFHYSGEQICRDTFLKLHGIGKMLCAECVKQSISQLQD